MPNPQRPESARDAVELMTAWLECDDGAPGPFIACLRSKLDGRSSRDSGAGAVELIMGLVYLSGSLLVLLEQEAGIPARETVQALAVEYAPY
jgi:hypothetical protein